MSQSGTSATQEEMTNAGGIDTNNLTLFIKRYIFANTHCLTQAEIEYMSGQKLSFGLHKKAKLADLMIKNSELISRIIIFLILFFGFSHQKAALGEPAYSFDACIECINQSLGNNFSIGQHSLCRCYVGDQNISSGQRKQFPPANVETVRSVVFQETGRCSGNVQLGAFSASSAFSGKDSWEPLC